MPKLKYNPVDTGPTPTGGAMFAKIFGLVVMALALVGVAYMLLTYSWEDKPDRWEWQHEDIRTNFHQLMTTEEIKQHFREKQERWLSESGLDEIPADTPAQTDPEDEGDDIDAPEFPFGEDEDNGDRETAIPPDMQSGINQGEEAARNREHELKLAEQLEGEKYFDLAEEAQEFIETVQFRDASREQCMNEWAAYQGRQAPVHERLALKVLDRLPPADGDGYDAFRDGLAADGWFYGESQDAIEKYRGHGFPVAGRLFDLYEINPEEPIVLPDGTSFDRYYEGVVALLGPGLTRNEHPVEQRTVMFHTLSLPGELEEYVNETGHVSHDDRLAEKHIMVELSGVYLRRWVYGREVMPYSTRNQPVRTQDWLPLLLTRDVRRSDLPRYELTDELLQQVRDVFRDDPSFLETEAAYYALLDRARDPDDEFEVVDEIGYFDLAGQETGPRYRGQGIRVVGMIGDNYAPVILPPNISGLRRVFRALVLHDTANLESPRRYMVDMIEPPTGLEPRAIVNFKARYYRNVFEAESTRAPVRPLLITRRIKGHAEGADDSDWIYAALGIGGLLLLMTVLAVFVLSEKRERTRFEQSTLELSQKRLKARGGLKLKPLPESEGATRDRDSGDGNNDPPHSGKE